MTELEQIQKLVDSGELKIISLLTAVRTVGTALSRSLSAHPDVDTEVLQPFHLHHPVSGDEDREESAYGIILNAYYETKKHSDKPVTIVVKEMARNLLDPEILYHWDQLSDKHLIVSRNPLLSTEALMKLFLNWIEESPEGLEQTARKFAEEHGHQPTPEYLRSFPNIYAKHLEYEDKSSLGQHWKALAEFARSHRDYTMLGDVLDEFSAYYDHNTRFSGTKAGYISLVDDKAARREGYEGLDDFAKKQGFHNWKSLLAQEQTDKILPLFQDSLITNFTGSAGLHYLLEFFRDDDRALVIDGSILRADPERVMTAICEHIGLDKDYIPLLLNWDGQDLDKKSHSEHIEPAVTAAYVRAHNSTQFILPTEPPVSPSRFPERFRTHYFNVALPSHLDALSDEKCVRPHGKEELLELLNKKTSEGSTLKAIDPVWAYSLISTDNSISIEEKRMMLDDIREAPSPFCDVLDAIDRISKDIVVTRYGSASKALRVGK